MLNTKQYDWTNPKAAQLAALRVLNQLLLNARPIEEMAQSEAELVESWLKNELHDDQQLIDYLHQAAIDVSTQIVNKRKNT